MFAVIITLNDDPTKTIESIFRQEMRISKIIVVAGSKRLFDDLLCKKLRGVEVFFAIPDFAKPLGVRIGEAFNVALSKVKIIDFDYFLRVDADVVLPSPQFLTINFDERADVIGLFGECMLVKTCSFMRILGGTWPESVMDDTYVLHMMSKYGKTRALVLPPIILRRAGKYYSWQNFFNQGESWYKMGYEPFHAFVGSMIGIRTNSRTIWALFGYANALVRRAEKYEFSDWLFKNQLSLFRDLKKLNSRIRTHVLPFFIYSL